MTDPSFRQTVNGFPLLPNYAIADLTSDLFAGHAHDIGLPHEGMLDVAREARESFLALNSTQLNIFEIQNISSNFLKLVTSRLNENDASLFSIWFDAVSPHMNPYQPIIDGWSTLLVEQASGLYGEGPPPEPAASVMALIGTVVDQLPFLEDPLLSEWDTRLSGMLGTHEGDLYDLPGALTTTILSSGARYLWSWAASRVERPDWNALAGWAQGTAADQLSTDGTAVDLGEILPLPELLYKALPQPEKFH